MGMSRRITSPMARLSNSRTRCVRWEAIRCGDLKFRRDLLDGVALDGIAGLIFVEALDANAAFHAAADFVDFILESAQRLRDAFVDETLSAHYTDFAFDNAPGGNNAASHVAAFGQFKNFPYFR